MHKIKNPIFVLNAPKRCGKDTVAKFMQDKAWFENPIEKTSFKLPIFEVFDATVEIPEMYEMYDVGDWKDTVHPALNGKTPRDLLIHISENYIKPFFGKDYYGQWVADYIDRAENNGDLPYTWVIPDGGFKTEIDVLYERFPDRLVVVQFSRPGFESFVGDSRNYINHDKAMTLLESNKDGSEALAGRLLAMIDND